MTNPVDGQIDIWISNAERSGDLEVLMSILDAKSRVILTMLEQKESCDDRKRRIDEGIHESGLSSTEKMSSSRRR
jgi:hypothetical protein